MNRSCFSKTRYMIWVGLKKLARTPVPKRPSSYHPEKLPLGKSPEMQSIQNMRLKYNVACADPEGDMGSGPPPWKITSYMGYYGGYYRNGLYQGNSIEKKSISGSPVLMADKENCLTF